MQSSMDTLSVTTTVQHFYFFSAGFATGADIGIAAPPGFWKNRWFVYITESPPPFSLHGRTSSRVASRISQGLIARVRAYVHAVMRSDGSRVMGMDWAALCEPQCLRCSNRHACSDTPHAAAHMHASPLN